MQLLCLMKEPINYFNTSYVMYALNQCGKNTFIFELVVNTDVPPDIFELEDYLH